MRRPLLLDLFSGAGGAAMGYHRAGFDVIGVDIEPQPDYPFIFIQGDALEYLREAPPGYIESTFAAIHASPPCQASSALTKGTNQGREYPQLIPETRRLLDGSRLPYVIENVQGSDLRRDLTLCGEGSVAEWQEAMGIDWTDNRKSIAEAIPPAYSLCIGRYLLTRVRAAA